MANLFVWGEFKAHSGDTLWWKIDCDALSDHDIQSIASIIASRVQYSCVEGVPRGGLRLAERLRGYQRPGLGYPLLIVDDVCTTGRSLEEHRAGREAVGYVIFSRSGLPTWAQALFTLDSSKQ